MDIAWKFPYLDQHTSFFIVQHSFIPCIDSLPFFPYSSLYSLIQEPSLILSCSQQVEQPSCSCIRNLRFHVFCYHLFPNWTIFLFCINELSFPILLISIVFFSSFPMAFFLLHLFLAQTPAFVYLNNNLGCTIPYIKQIPFPGLSIAFISFKESTPFCSPRSLPVISSLP